MADKNDVKQEVEKDIEIAAESAYEEANEGNPLPDKVTITADGKSNTYDVELKSSIKAWLPYVIALIWGILTVLATTLKWKLPFTSQQLTDLITTIVFFGISIFNTWKDNPITLKSKFEHAVGSFVHKFVSSLGITGSTTEAQTTKVTTKVPDDKNVIQ
ncbi:hypothetical protein [Lactobacillus acetotolerans]|uniref:hypothetical protein n=1 Tax=Lactobacillus acetotolerans TaxID=1600 RepID=UPI002FD95DE0